MVEQEVASSSGGNGLCGVLGDPLLPVRRGGRAGSARPRRQPRAGHCPVELHLEHDRAEDRDHHQHVPEGLERLTSARSGGAPAAAVSAAVAFVTAWARPGLSEKALAGRCDSPGATPVLDEWSAVHRSPQGAGVKGDRIREGLARSAGGDRADQCRTGGGRATVPTNAGPVVVELALAGGRWFVSSIQPATS